MYFNYKSYYCIFLQGVVDATYKLMIIDGGYGKQTDGGRFRSLHMFAIYKYQPAICIYWRWGKPTVW